MENQIFSVGAGISKSMVLTGHELWFSQNKVRNMEKFQKEITNEGLLASGFKVPLANIHEISYNEASQAAKIKYINEKGKEKKLNINFSNKDLSNQFGQYLGEKLDLFRSSSQEGKIKPLLWNVFILGIAVLMTVLMATMDDSSQLAEVGGKNAGKAAFLKLIVDTLGQTTVVIIGALISLFLAYKLFKRFTNPSSEILYSKDIKAGSAA